MTYKGFTLIETLVSIVILSTVFATVWTWFGTATISTQKVTNATELPFVIDQFIENLNQQPLHQISKGNFEYLDYSIAWAATPIRESNTEFFRRQLEWNAALFNIDIKVSKNNRPVLSSSTRHYYHWKNPDFVPPEGF